jgi:hypothetical protein
MSLKFYKTIKPKNLKVTLLLVPALLYILNLSVVVYFESICNKSLRYCFCFTLLKNWLEDNLVISTMTAGLATLNCWTVLKQQSLSKEVSDQIF